MMNNDDIRRAVFEASGKSVEVGEQKVRALKKRIKKDKRLPETPSMFMLEIFLVMNKFDIDISQKKLGMYYQMRTEMPELFHDKNPSSPHMQKIADVVYHLTLPKLTPELHRVNMFKFQDTNPKNLVSYNFAAHMFNCSELNLVSGKYAVGELYVFDLEGVSLRHLFNFSMNLIRKMAKVNQEVYSPRMKGIHFFNCPRFMDAILVIAKAVLKQKLAARIHVHKSKDTLKEFIPENILPKDYGGQEASIDELRETQKKEFVKYRKRFEELEHLTKTEVSD